jgi:hypothetical protein
MVDVMVTGWLDVYRCWWRAAATLAWGPWQLLGAQREAALKMFDPLTRGLAPEAPGPGREAEAPIAVRPAGPEELERLAAERLKQGLAPPREVYDVRNRERMDWLMMPAWARPTDPELFEGCPHEG